MKKILLISLLMALFGCKNIQCPAFPEKLLDYFPQKNGELLQFRNLANDTLIFIVKNTKNTGGYTMKKDENFECVSEAGFETESNNKYSLQISAGMTAYESNVTTIGCSFSDGTYSRDLLSMAIRDKNPFLKDNNSFFGDSIIIDQEENTRIVKVKIVEGKGIVEFFDKKENCNWIKIE